jgi:hypothetical protein
MPFASPSSRTPSAQIRWPDRDDVKALLGKFPAAVEKFADKLHETAGGTIELRSKKL